MDRSSQDTSIYSPTARASVNDRPAIASDQEAPAMHPQDFAPPGDPARIEQVAKLSGDAIRSAAQSTGAAIMKLVDDAEVQVKNIREDAEGFVTSLKEVGEAHAVRIENALRALTETTKTIANERNRIAEITMPKAVVPTQPTTR